VSETPRLDNLCMEGETFTCYSLVLLTFSLLCLYPVFNPFKKYDFFPRRNNPKWARASSLSRLHDHTQDTPHSLRLIQTSDNPDEKICTRQKNSQETDISRRDSNLQFQQERGSKPTPSAVQPLGSAHKTATAHTIFCIRDEPDRSCYEFSEIQCT